MAKSNPETIVLRGKNPVQKEGRTDEALSPGHVVERGGTADIQKNTVANRVAGFLIACENAAVGGSIDDAYAANDNVVFVAAYPGMEVYVRIAAGESITKNELLTCAAAGLVQNSGATQANACGIALETKDNSSGTTETFVKMEIV